MDELSRLLEKKRKLEEDQSSARVELSEWDEKKQKIDEIHERYQVEVSKLEKKKRKIDKVYKEFQVKLSEWDEKKQKIRADQLKTDKEYHDVKSLIMIHRRDECKNLYRILCLFHKSRFFEERRGIHIGWFTSPDRARKLIPAGCDGKWAYHIVVVSSKELGIDSIIDENPIQTLPPKLV